MRRDPDGAHGDRAERATEVDANQESARTEASTPVRTPQDDRDAARGTMCADAVLDAPRIAQQEGSLRTPPGNGDASEREAGAQDFAARRARLTGHAVLIRSRSEQPDPAAVIDRPCAFQEYSRADARE